MVREAFHSRKRFLGVPNISSAAWVGTIKHSCTMDDGVEREEQRHCCGSTRTIVKVTKNMAHTTEKQTRHIQTTSQCRKSEMRIHMLWAKETYVRHKSSRGIAVKVIMTKHIRKN